MINRFHGLSDLEVKRISVNIYSNPMLYVGNEEDIENEKFETLVEFVEKWIARAKLQFPLCNFWIRTTGIHDADYRIYAEVVIESPDGSHTDAAEWLTWKTE